MCKGECEGAGWFPVAGQVDYVCGLLHMDDPDEDPRIIELWRKAHETSHTWKFIIRDAWKMKSISHLWKGRECDGWHFVKCPDCKGTGKAIK